jgi:predicted transglutaminase-like cysteine proteinase
MIAQILRAYYKAPVIAVSVSLAVFQAPAMAASPAYMLRGLSHEMAFMKEGSPTLAPFAHIKFCMESPQQCAAEDGPRTIEMTREARDTISAINRSVNLSIAPRLDPPGQEVWKTDTPEGSCHDYAVTKREKLIAAGYSAKAVRLAVARTGSGEGHAVVVIRTSDGDMVLDNRTNAIRRWDRTDLHWIEIESSDDPHMWNAV